MRSPAEIHFRLRQELRNLWLWKVRPAPPAQSLTPPCPLPGLPDPEQILAAVRTTAYARELTGIADELLAHRFRLLGLDIIETGPEIRWRRDYVHGTETPPEYFRRIRYLEFAEAGDHKIIWELNRHQHLVLLAQAWRITGERKYIDEVFRQLESWLEQNPFQCGINWCSALEVAFRALSWTWIWHLAGSSMSAGLAGRFLTSLYQHGLHLEDNLSVYFSPNTHLLGEALALGALGVLFPAFPRSGKWAKTGDDWVRREMDHQVHADGSHFEQSTYYHVYATDMFLFHAVLHGGRVSEPYRRKLAAMVDYVDALLGQPGRIPLIGDDDGGRFFHPWGQRDTFGTATVAVASLLLDESRWEWKGDDAWDMAAWWLGGRALHRHGSNGGRNRPSGLFRDTGMAILRHDDVELFFDVGPFGPGSAGHSHSDTLSIVLRRGGEDILIDSGTYTYISDTASRNAFRGSGGHNTLLPGGRDQAVPRGPFAWIDKPTVKLLEWQSRGSDDVVSAECVYGDFRHKRTVRFDKSTLQLEIDDELTGPASEFPVEAYWHVGQEVVPVSDTMFAVGAGVRMQLPASATLKTGWRSRSLGHRESNAVICITHIAVSALRSKTKILCR
jgi:hypothetical protein